MQSRIDALLERIRQMNKDAGITVGTGLQGYELDRKHKPECPACTGGECTCQNHT